MNYSLDTIEDALAVLPHLVYAAQQRKTITYGELAEKIGKHHRPARLWLAYIRDEICIPKELPYLTAIVVGQVDGLPGDSFLPEGTDHLSPGDYESAFIRHRDRVFSDHRWDDLLRELGLKSIQKRPQDLDEEGRIYAEVLSRQESDANQEHRRKLMNHVVANPARIGLYTKGATETEVLFGSGDMCDIVFDLGELGAAVVIIRFGERGELIHGIYHADKCRDLMEAEKGHGIPSPVRAILVAYDIPDDIAAFAEKLDIRSSRIRLSTVERYSS